MSIPAHPFSWNSRLLKVQKHDNKQNFDYTTQTVNIDGTFWSFSDVNKGHRNIIASSLGKGTFKTEVKEKIAETLSYILPKPFFLNGYYHIQLEPNQLCEPIFQVHCG